MSNKSCFKAFFQLIYFDIKKCHFHRPWCTVLLYVRTVMALRVQNILDDGDLRSGSGSPSQMNFLSLLSQFLSPVSLSLQSTPSGPPHLHTDSVTASSQSRPLLNLLPPDFFASTTTIAATKRVTVKKWDRIFWNIVLKLVSIFKIDSKLLGRNLKIF